MGLPTASAAAIQTSVDWNDQHVSASHSPFILVVAIAAPTLTVSHDFQVGEAIHKFRRLLQHPVFSRVFLPAKGPRDGD
jgi:hypothetical protein